MKNVFFAFLLLTAFLPACKSSSTQKAIPLAIMKDTTTLQGKWELKALPGSLISFEGLYKRKIPLLSFDLVAQQVSGNTGCNSFSGKFSLKGSSIGFTEPMTMTQMACPGEGEKIFLQTLQKVTTYSIQNDSVLVLSAGEKPLMQLKRK